MAHDAWCNLFHHEVSGSKNIKPILLIQYTFDDSESLREYARHLRAPTILQYTRDLEAICLPQAESIVSYCIYSELKFITNLFSTISSHLYHLSQEDYFRLVIKSVAPRTEWYKQISPAYEKVRKVREN